MKMGEINEWADFWRKTVGVNVIPANSLSKTTYIKWKEDPRGNWQVQPIPEWIHEEWKKTCAFKDGMAVICGKIHHNAEWAGHYLCAIDLDNKKAIEVLAKNNLAGLAKETLVEAHANPNKAHIYFYTTKPMPKKSSDAINLELLQKIQANEIPAIEMKGDGTHGIMYCAPSPHKDGSNYMLLNKRQPQLYDRIGEVVNKICDEFGLGKGRDNLVPMTVLMADDTRVVEGSNRHEAIMRYAESLLRKYPSMENQIFNDIIAAKNQRMCVPPLDDKTLIIQIQCAKDYIAKQIVEEQKMREEAKHRFNTEEFWRAANEYRLMRAPTGYFVKCAECNKLIDAKPYNNAHDGHKVMFV